MKQYSLRQGCNVIAYKKNNINYGMVCAWVSLVDYDKLVMLLGGQSVTGNNIKVGDVIGVSALADNQKNIALKIGSNHSDKVDKFVNIPFIYDGDAILIQNAKSQMKCKVTKIDFLSGNNVDHLVFVDILKHEEDGNAKFLALEDVL